MAEQRKERVGETQRLSRAQAEKDYPIEPTEREFKLFIDFAVGGVRGYTTDQIERLYFPGNRTSCNDRLLRLFQNRYLWRFRVNLQELGFTQGRWTLMHTLDQEGVTAAAHQLGVPVASIPWRPADRTIERQELKHIILNNDIRISLKLAISQLQNQWQADHPDATKGYEITFWETDQTIRQKPETKRFIVDYVPPSDETQTSEVGEIVPDDLMIIQTPAFAFISFIELDTGSEVRTPQARPVGKDSSVASKVRKYLALLYKPPKEEGGGKEPSKFEQLAGIKNQRGVRVFIITTAGEKGVESLLETIRAAGGLGTYWVGRYDLAKREDLILTRPIWRKAGAKEPVFFSWLGTKTEELRMRLGEYGVAVEDIEARVSRITELAREQLADGWNEQERGMSLEQGVALRADELTEAMLRLFTDRLRAEEERRS